MRTPSLRFLKTFQIAAKRGSFKAAADELCVTASAISHQIKVLEDEPCGNHASDSDVSIVRSVSDLAQEPLIAHNHRPDLWDRWAAMSGIDPLRPKQLIRFDTMSAVVHAAEQGVGVALVSTPLSASRFLAGSLTELFDAELATGESYYLVTRPGDADIPAVRLLSGWMLQQFGAVVR